MAWSHSGNTLISGDHNGNIKYWQVGIRQLTRVLIDCYRGNHAFSESVVSSTGMASYSSFGSGQVAVTLSLLFITTRLSFG